MIIKAVAILMALSGLIMLHFTTEMIRPDFPSWLVFAWMTAGVGALLVGILVLLKESE